VKDEANKVGELRVVEVGTSSCVAELDGPGAAAVKSEDLKAARAVEVERAIGARPLRVLFEGIERPDASLKPYAIIATTDEAGRSVTRKTYQVRVRPAGTLDPKTGKEVLVDAGTGKEVVASDAPDPQTGKILFIDPATGMKVSVEGEPRPKLTRDRIWVQDRSGEVLEELPAVDAAKDIVEALLNEWQARYLAEELKRGEDRNQSINIKLFVEAVTVAKDPRTGEIEIKEVLKDVNADGTMRLRDGDRIRISVQNASAIPVFVTVLRIGRDGVFPIFPRPQEDLEGLGFRREGGVNWRLDPGKAPSPIPGLISKMTKPYGTDLYKVIATKEPANFSGLLFRRRLPPGLGGKGPADTENEKSRKKAPDEIAKLPDELHPLARLLRKVVDGAKGEEPEFIGTEWATAEKRIEVLPPTGQ